MAQATPHGRVALSQAGPAEGSPYPDGGPARGPGALSEALAARLAVPHGLYRRPETPTEVRFLPWAKPGMEQEARLERSWAGQHGVGREVERRQMKVSEKKESGRMAQEGRSTRSKGKGRRARPTSPELGRGMAFCPPAGTELAWPAPGRVGGPPAHPWEAWGAQGWSRGA